MIFLALETATSRQSMAVFRDQDILGSVQCDTNLSLTPQIIPKIQELLNEVSLAIEDLEGLVVSIGPGVLYGFAGWAGYHDGLSICLRHSRWLESPH